MGNVRVHQPGAAGLMAVSGKYTGKGTSIKQLTFPFKPMLVIVRMNAANAYPFGATLIRGAEGCSLDGFGATGSGSTTNNYNISWIEWGEDYVSFSSDRLNQSGAGYLYLAIGT